MVSILKKNKKAPRASKRFKKNEKYEEKLSIWFTTSILFLVLIALVIFFINKIETNGIEAIAIINGEKITAVELEKWYKISINPEFRSTITMEDFLIESLIPQTILFQEANNAKVKVSKEDVETEIGQFLIDSGLNLKEFEKKLKNDGTKLSYVEDAFMQRLVITKFLEQIVLADVDVSSSEVNEIFKNTKSLDPSLSSNDVKQILYEQLLKGKHL